MDLLQSLQQSRRHFLKRTSQLSLGGGTALILPAGAAFAQSEQTTVVAKTQYGKVRGEVKHGVNVFKGIPYGADTSGNNRFKPAQPPASWTDIRDAFNYGQAAPQSNPASGKQQDDNEGENCLAINLWSRGIADGGKRPVMVWLHGGGFSSLSASTPGYDGTNLCLRGDVVVVTLNHRLNCMGFLDLSSIGGEEYAKSGNVGVLDLVTALRWVRDNIEQFGGDPDRVMIFGESGGGRKVSTLLSMPDAKGLFHSAVIQSGATIKVAEPEDSAKMAEKFLQELGLNKNSLDKINDLPLSTLLAAYSKLAGSPGAAMGFQPVKDGKVIPYHPYSPTASPINPDVPVIIGANRTEMTLFARESDYDMDEASMRTRVQRILNNEAADEVIKTYQSAYPKASPGEIYYLIFSDQRYVMPSITIAERRSALKKAPIYLYYLTWETPLTGAQRYTPHSLDIPFVFDNVRTHPMTKGSDDAIQLAAKVSAAWINFARTGNPNTPALNTWEPYDAKQRATMVLNSNCASVDDPLAAQRKGLTPLLDL